MTAPKIVFRRKGTRVIYPFTEANAKNSGLIPMSIEEATAEGLLTPKPKVESQEDERIKSLEDTNRKLLAKLQEMEDAADKPAPVKKKRAAKKAAPKEVVVDQDVPVPTADPDKLMTLSDIGINAES